jgi:hypothetical protein
MTELDLLEIARLTDELRALGPHDKKFARVVTALMVATYPPSADRPNFHKAKAVELAYWSAGYMAGVEFGEAITKIT